MLELLLIALLSQTKPELQLPSKITGQPATMIQIKCETKGEIVKFVSLDKGLELLPAELLIDKKSTVVVAKKPGTFKLLAYTAVENKLSDPVFADVIITENGEVPVDKLFQRLSSIYGSDVSATKSDDLKRLIIAFNIVYNTDFNNIPTNADIFKAVEMIFKQANIKYESLRSLRDAIADFMIENLGSDPDTKFDQKKFKDLIQNIIVALNKLGGQ